MRRLLLALALAGCVDVADERAARDARIGQVDDEALGVEIEDGLAHVRALEPGALTLWAQAPVLRMRLDVRRGGPWRVTVRNAMADARLCVDGTCHDPVEQPIPTEKTWALTLEAGREYTVDVAPPDAGDEAPFRFVIYADVQDHIDDVQDIYASMASQPGVRFGLISGDLTESGSGEQLRRFQREMRTLPFPCFATPGNHDLGGGDHLFQRHFGRASFSFAYRGARFSLVDSASATVAPRVYGWLDDWMDRAGDRPHLVMMHIPPLDPTGLRNGAFASRAEAMKIVSRMARGGVDLNVYGHVHSFYAFRNAGVDALISGGGGAIPERLDGIGRHYLLMDAVPEEERFRWSIVRVRPED